jgi:putative addiction module killer protein
MLQSSLHFFPVDLALYYNVSHGMLIPQWIIKLKSFQLALKIFLLSSGIYPFVTKRFALGFVPVLTDFSLGNFGDSKPISEGIFELRLHFGAGYRIYFAQVGSSIVVLLGGGDKRSQSQDIQLAISL